MAGEDSIEKGDFGGAFDSYIDNRDSGGSDDSESSSGSSSGSDNSDDSTDSDDSGRDESITRERRGDPLSGTDSEDPPVGNTPSGPSSPVGGGSSGGSSGESSDGSSGGSDNPFGGDDGTDLPDEPSVDNDNPFDGGGSSGSGSSGGSSSGSSGEPSGSDGSSDNGSSGSDSGGGDSPPVGNTPDSGNLPSQSGESPESGQGIGPDGVSGSEAATPNNETDPTTDRDGTENIEATRTGRLEDIASDPEIRQQAEQLEDEAVGQPISDSVDGLRTTGAVYRDEDIEVVPVDEQGNVVDDVNNADKLQRQLSPVGKDRVENIAERQQEEAAERAVEDELNTAFDDSDVSVNDDGGVDVSEDVRQEAVKQDIAATYSGVGEDDVSFENGQPQVDQPQPQQPNSPTEPTAGRGQEQEQPTVQEPTEFVEENPDEIPSDPLLDRQTRAGIRGAANDVANTLVGTDSPDSDVQQQLTSGTGIADAQEEQQIAEDIEQRQEFFGVSEEAEAFAEDTTGSETVGQAAAGLGRLPGEAAAATAGLTLVADKGVETGSNFVSTAQNEGVIDTSETVLNTITDTARDQVVTVRENPVREGAALAGGIVAGTAATKAVSRSAQGVSNLNTRRKADATVDFEDITSERGAEGELPEFETSPEAPTSEAVQEVRQRAADQPQEIQTTGQINTASGELGYRAGQRVGEIVPDSTPIKTPDISRPETPDVPTPDVANRLGRATGRVSDRLPDRQSTPDRTPDGSDGGTTLNEAVRNRAESTLDSAEQRGRAAGERAGNRVQDARERLSDAAEPVTERASDALDRAEQRGRAAGERVGEGVRETRERLDDATEPVADRIDRAAASASAAANRPFDAAEQAGQRAGRRLGEAERAAGFEGVSVDNGYSEGALFRSESDRLPADLEAQEGQYELPGLFASPDASPLRTDLGASRSLSDFKPRLARPSDLTPTTQRLSAFEGDRIEGMPSRAAGSGRVSGPDGEPMPDPDAAGTQFLRSDAEEGTAFVRATGDRTTELEAVFPEGSEFRRQRQLAVDMPNDEVATLDVFERRGSSANGPGSGRRSDLDSDSDPEPVFRSDDIRELERRRTQSPDGQAVSPTPSLGSGSGQTDVGGGSAGVSSGLDSGRSRGPSDATTPGGSGLSDLSVSSGLTGFSSEFSSPGLSGGFDSPGFSGSSSSSTFTTDDGSSSTPGGTTFRSTATRSQSTTTTPWPKTTTRNNSRLNLPEFEDIDTEPDEIYREFEEVEFENAVATPADVLGIEGLSSK